jgi:hypothetical protein
MSGAKRWAILTSINVKGYMHIQACVNLSDPPPLACGQIRKPVYAMPKYSHFVSAPSFLLCTSSSKAACTADHKCEQSRRHGQIRPLRDSAHRSHMHAHQGSTRRLRKWAFEKLMVTTAYQANGTYLHSSTVSLALKGTIVQSESSTLDALNDCPSLTVPRSYLRALTERPGYQQQCWVTYDGGDGSTGQ